MLLGLRSKLMVTTSILFFVCFAVFAYISAKQQRDQLEGELTTRTRLLNEQIMIRGQLLAVNIAQRIAAYVAAFAYSEFKELDKSVQQDDLLREAILIDESGIIVYHTSDKSREGDVFSLRPGLKKVNNSQEAHIYAGGENRTETLIFVVPIEVALGKWWQLRMYYDLTKPNMTVDQDRARANTAIKRIYQTKLVILLLVMAFGFSIIFVLLRKLVSPLSDLTEAANILTKTDFGSHLGHELPHKKAKDEVGDLSRSLSKLLSKLEISYENLEEANSALEQKVAHRTQEISEKNAQLEASLQEVKSMQDKIVVQEKLASLGSLTAGIAHEIKNPLNFIINFSKLTRELASDLSEDYSDPAFKFDEDSRENFTEIIHDICKNTEKISEHGQRADRIIKNMLDHSRGDGSEIRASNINTVVEESVNLAYHGMRAQNPAFQVKIVGHYRASNSPINIQVQELNRVILNIVSNACYAVHERANSTASDEGEASVGIDFEPTIEVATEDRSDNVAITVRDNGTGISKKTIEHIFDPFFTTKPAGLGTGLGLSICYEIITNVYEGQLTVESVLGEYTKFTIVFPKTREASPALGIK